MATIAVPQTSSIAAERRFFLWMAVVFAITTFAGFGLNFAAGRVSAATLPVQVYLHGAAFLSWVLLYVVQCALVDRGSVAVHRRLGWFGAVLSAGMVPLGIAVTVMAMRRGAVPFFFPPNIFLVVNVVGVVVFGVLVAAAIALRKRPEWHRRLMYCAALELIAPAFGRLLPMPLLGAWGPWAIMGSLLVYALVGVLFDLARRGRVHPAWWWGVAAILTVNVVMGPIAFSAPVSALAGQLVKR